MGHTVLSQRRALDMLLVELAAYRRALRPEDQAALDEILRMPLAHFGSVSNASSVNTWGMLLLCVCVEQQKRIIELERARLERTVELEHGAGRRVPERVQDRALAEDA